MLHRRACDRSYARCERISSMKRTEEVLRVDADDAYADRLARLRALGEAIRSARLYAGVWTQQELADLLGVGQTTVSRWERGAEALRLSSVVAVENALGVPRGSILRGAGYIGEDAEPEGVIEMVFVDHR